MNPSSNETQGMQLPAPVFEQPVPTGNQEQLPAATFEQAPAAPSLPPVSAAPVAVPPAPMLVPAAPQTNVTNTTAGASQLVADDGDLIEKEWVNKAKAIVEQSRDDPHKQSEQLTAVKADYLKQRYNKALKLNT